MKITPRACLTASLAGLLATLVAGCTVGPDYVRPELRTEVPDGYVADRDQATAAADTLPVADYWWSAFSDSTLDWLVDEALRRNNDLTRATAAVFEARALLGGAKSDRWPKIDLGASASRQKNSLAMLGVPRSIYRSSFDVSATASYELDLWGRLARGEENAQASLLASEMNRRTVSQTLIADVVRTWLQVRELQCQLGLTLRTVESFSSTLNMVEERYASGVVPALDVRLARQNLLIGLSAEPLLRQQLAEAVRRLEILAGHYPAARVVAGDDALYQTQVMPSPLPEVPAGLPSTLLERRPDLVATEAQLHAATAAIGQQKARLFPTISLTAGGGYTSPELENVFDPSSSIWNLAGNLFMPLVNRGAITAQVEAAEARAQQAAAGYQQAILNAFAEVENALDALRLQQESLDVQQRSVNEARRSLELAEDRYFAGLDNLLTTLESQRRLFNAESDLLATQRSHRTARVNLILALGGPWDEQALATANQLAAAPLAGAPEGEQQ